jgi:hypothetical protein
MGQSDTDMEAKEGLVKQKSFRESKWRFVILMFCCLVLLGP